MFTCGSLDGIDGIGNVGIGKVQEVCRLLHYLLIGEYWTPNLT